MAWAELSDVRCYYELHGQGEPVLLIPGLGATCRLWDPLVSCLEPSLSLILLDNRGVGQSIARRTASSIADLASDCVELLDELQLDKVHVVGVSLGGIIAQRLAIEHPSRVDRLVLISCAHHFGPYLREMAALLAHTLRYFPWELFVRTVELLGTAPEFLDKYPERMEQKIELVRRAGVCRKDVIRQLRCLAVSDISSEDYRIIAPTLVMAGEYDALIPNFYARKMAEEIPGSEFILARGAGHNPAVERPELVARHVTEFLARGRERNGVERQTSGECVGLG